MFSMWFHLLTLQLSFTVSLFELQGKDEEHRLTPTAVTKKTLSCVKMPTLLVNGLYYMYWLVSGCKALLPHSIRKNPTRMQFPKLLLNHLYR